MTIEGLMEISKEVKITYAELDRVLKVNYGFSSRVEKSDDEVKERLLGEPRYFICYSDKAGKLVYALFQKEDETLVKPYDLFHIARVIHDYGYAKKYESLILAIKKQRLPKKAAA
jgi:hypothetical protein